MSSNKCNVLDTHLNKNNLNDNSQISNYALKVALHTMKERCQKLQNRLSCLEEENLQLRIERHSIPGVTKKERDILLDNVSLHKKIEELNRQKSQLSHHIFMVATENKELWERLSKLSDDKNLEAHSRNLLGSSNKHANVVPVKSIQIFELCEGTKEESLEEISLKVLNSIRKTRSSLEGSECDDAMEWQTNALNVKECEFNIKRVEGQSELDGIIHMEIKDILDKLNLEKAMLKQQQEELKSALEFMIRVSKELFCEMVSTRQSSNVGAASEATTTEAGGIKTRHSAHHSHSQEIVPVAQTREYVSNKHFLDLPPEIFDKIFSYTGYKTVSQMRLVCRQLDRTCGSILNSTFQKLQTQMLHRFHFIKSKMPRRESARRNHPLACESDIIETLHMRLTLLQMSFGKHIERKHCCFFAGEILDEVFRILHYIKVTPKLARPYRVTDELFDLSTMAMEYFKENIEPTLPEIAYFGTDFFDFGSLHRGSIADTSNNKSWMFESPPHSGSAKTEYESAGASDERPTPPPPQSPQPQSNIVLRKRIRKIKQGMKKYNSQLTIMKRELRNCKTKMAEQQKQFHEYASRMDDYDKKNEETSRKFSTLLQELNKCKTELQYWRSKSPLSSLCVTCGKMTAGGVFSEEFQLFTGTPSTFGFEEPIPSTSAAAEDTSNFIIATSTSAPQWQLQLHTQEQQQHQQQDNNTVQKLQPSNNSTNNVVVSTASSVQQQQQQQQPTKRKSVSDETPITHTRKQKRPRAMLKVRSKRS